MLRWIFIPFYSYILLLPVVAFMESIGGRGTVGNAFDEYLIVVQIVIILNIFHIIRKKGFTKDPK